jgi:hypothetical protein
MFFQARACGANISEEKPMKLQKWFVPIVGMRGFQERRIRADSPNAKYDSMLRSAQIVEICAHTISIEVD